MKVTITHKARNLKPGRSMTRLALTGDDATAAAHMVAADIARSNPNAVLIHVTVCIEADVLLDTEGNDATE